MTLSIELWTGRMLLAKEEKSNKKHIFRMSN